MNENEKNNDNYFDFGNSNLQQVLKKTKRKQVVKYVLITVLTMVICIGGGIKGSQFLLNHRMNSLDHSIDLVRGANTIIEGTYTVDTNFFSKTIQTIYRKKVGNRSILWDKKTEKIPLFGEIEVVDRGKGLTEINKMDEKSQRQVRYNDFNNETYIDFYYPQLVIEDLPQELEIAVDLDDDKLVEVALSFKKSMNISDVPEQLGIENVNWLWVDTTTPEQIEKMNKEKELTWNSNKIKEGEEAIGFYLRPDLELTKDSGQEFIQYLKLLNTSNGGNHTIKAALANLKEKIKQTNGEVLISGAVVSGTPEELTRFRELNFIKASVIGATIDKY